MSGQVSASRVEALRTTRRRRLVPCRPEREAGGPRVAARERSGLTNGGLHDNSGRAAGGAWRQVLATGAAVGMAVPVSRAVIAALGPWLGYGWAFAAC